MEPTAQPLSDDRSFWLWLASISAFGLLLRLWDLDGISIWGDEILQAREVISVYRLDFVAGLEGFVGHLTFLIALLASGADLQNLEPTEYEAFLEAGITPSSLRLAPAIIGAATVPIIGAMARRMLGHRQALVLALLLAIAPWHLYWSQGARFYAVQFLFYTMAFLWYFEATEDRSQKKLVLSMLFFVLAFNAQYTSFVFVAVIAADWLISRFTARPVRLNVNAFAVIGVAVACCVAMPVFLLLQVDTYATNHFGSLGNPPWQIAAGIVLLIHPVAFLMAAVSSTLADAMAFRPRIYLVLGAVVPIVLVSALSFRNYSGSRYGFVALFPVLALVAVGAVHVYDRLTPTTNRLVAALPLLLVLGTFFVADVDYYTFNRGFRPQWETGAELVRVQHEPGEKVASNLPQLARYLLDDLGDDVLIKMENVEDQDVGVWILTTRDDLQPLLDRSVVVPDHWVQSFSTSYLVPRHDVEIWYIPSVSEPRADPPKAILGERLDQ